MPDPIILGADPVSAEAPDRGLKMIYEAIIDFHNLHSLHNILDTRCLLSVLVLAPAQLCIYSEAGLSSDSNGF